MNGISQRVMLPQSELLPKEGTRGAEIRYKIRTKGHLSGGRTDGQ